MNEEQFLQVVEKINSLYQTSFSGFTGMLAQIFIGVLIITVGFQYFNDKRRDKQALDKINEINKKMQDINVNLAERVRSLDEKLQSITLRYEMMEDNLNTTSRQSYLTTARQHVQIKNYGVALENYITSIRFELLINKNGKLGYVKGILSELYESLSNMIKYEPRLTVPKTDLLNLLSEIENRLPSLYMPDTDLENTISSIRNLLNSLDIAA